MPPAAAAVPAGVVAAVTSALRIGAISRLTNFAEGKNDGQKKEKPEANLGNRITPLGV
jgi:hypothetical protein